MIDPKFTEKIARWLESEHSTPEQIQAGAMLLLQLNRDGAMYQRITRRPQRELKFLEYKLRRFLRLRKDGQTIRDVIRLDDEITPQIQVAVETSPQPEEAQEELLPVVKSAQGDGDTGCYVYKGIRPDHAKLPEDIQAIWPANAERWKKIKETFETCKQLTEPCDRYEYLKVLKETWYKYKEEMARYDDFRPTDGVSQDSSAADQAPVLTPEQEKELKNADSYVSKNLLQLQQLVEASKEEDFNEAQKQGLESLRDRVQKRVDVLLQYGRTLSEERREQLLQCGIKVATPATSPSEDSAHSADNEQGQESE